MASEQKDKHEPLIKSPWRQVCGCLFFVMVYIVMMVYCTMHGFSFQLSLSLESLAFVAYLIFFILLFFLPQSILDRIGNKFSTVIEEHPLKKEIPIERAESDIPTDKVE